MKKTKRFYITNIKEGETIWHKMKSNIVTPMC